MRNYIEFFLFLFLAVGNAQIAQAQDVEKLAKDIQQRLEEKPLKISGSLSTDLQVSYSNGIDRRANPFSWRAYGQAMADLYGIRIPISLIFSTGSSVFNYKLPSFAFVGISPTYKWATLHLGDRSMNFSPYILSGHNFRGVGLELQPGKFRFRAMYGRLRRAVPEAINSIQNIEPAYKRMGWGFQTGYDDGKNTLLFTLFSAHDDPASIPPIRQTIGLTPAENVILGLSGKKQIGKIISLQIEMARSAVTTDVHSLILTTQRDLLQRAGGLFTPRLSSGYYHAIKTDLHFKSKIGNWLVGHEWVDPGYRTMGALYFNNDIERFTAGWTTSIFKNKLNFVSRFGLERNNLSGLEANNYRRILSSINFNYMPTREVNITASYSNFSNTNRLRSLDDPFSPVDSIVLALVNQNAGFGINYLLNPEGSSMLTAYLNWQEANSIQNDEVMAGQTNTFLVGNLAYVLRRKDGKFSFTPGVLIQHGQTGALKTFTWAPAITIGSSLLDKQLQLQSGISYSNAYINNNRSGGIFNWRTTTSYTFLENHRLGLNLLFIQRSVKTGVQQNFYEFRGMVNYGWQF